MGPLTLLDPNELQNNQCNKHTRDGNNYFTWTTRVKLLFHLLVR
jgi:hypothetical protein